MTDTPSPPPAGWYPDPSGAPGQRYWDGTAWTDQDAPPTAGQPQPSPVGLAQGPRPRNGLGIAALILGVLGALSGLIPLLFWIAGILGVIGLILGFVGRGRAKRGEATNGTMALWGIITSAVALLLSVVGLVIVIGAFEDLEEDLSGATPTVVATAEDSPPPEVDEEAEELPSDVAQIGSAGVTYEDGLQVAVPGIERFEPTEFAVGHTAGNVALMVTVTVTNGTAQPADMTLTTVNLASGESGRIAEQIYDDNVGVGFEGQVPPDRNATATFGFSVAPDDLGTVDVTVSPGFLDYSDAIFQGAVE
jgi:Protein of unknown function (DUF2510)/Domain of unknown function (DUF4190)